VWTICACRKIALALILPVASLKKMNEVALCNLFFKDLYSHVYIYGCIYIYICVYVYTNISMYTYMYIYIHIDVLRANAQTQTQEEVSAIKNMVLDQLEDVQKHFGKQVQNGGIYIYLKMCECVRACVHLKSFTNVSGNDFNKTLVVCIRHKCCLQSLSRVCALLLLCLCAYMHTHVHIVTGYTYVYKHTHNQTYSLLHTLPLVRSCVLSLAHLRALSLTNSVTHTYKRYTQMHTLGDLASINDDKELMDHVKKLLEIRQKSVSSPQKLY